MKEGIKLAKSKGLNWQTLVIEDAESEIKDIIRKGFLLGLTASYLSPKVNEVIKRTVSDLEDAQLKLTAERSLKGLAAKCYYGVQQRLGHYGTAVIAAMATLKGNALKTASGTNKAIEVISAARPLLQAINRNAPYTGYTEIAQPLDEFMKDYMKRVKQTFFEIAEDSAKDGDLSTRAISEMIERQRKQESDLERLVDKGENFAWISSHANCSKRCEPWQGKLYSLKGDSGTIDGIEFQPLTNATDIYTTTKAGKTYKNGCLSGFNCRHRLIPYRKGNKPIEVSAEVVERERNINDRQRALERKVRLYKERAIAIKDIDYDEYIKQKNLAIKTNAEYIKYSRENKVAYYPSRTAVFEPPDYVKARQQEWLNGK